MIGLPLMSEQNDLSRLRARDEQERFQRLHHDDTRTAVPRVDAEALAAELRRRTQAEVRFDDGSRALYATDGSNYRQVPIGVVVPRSVEDVIATVATAHEFHAPVLPRGCGTSLAGQCCNVAVVIDFTKYLNNVVRIDPDRKLGTVHPGCVLDDLRGAAKQHGLTFGPDPATHTHCALGGMLGNNSCGIHSLLCRKHGLGLRTSDNTHSLDVLTYDGLRLCVGETPPDELERIIQAGGPRGDLYARLKAFRDKYADDIRRGFPKLPRRVSGYNLEALLPENNFHLARALVGSEGTLVTILEATLHLIPEPKARALIVLGYPDIYSAGDHMEEILKFEPSGLEGIDHLLIEWLQQKGEEINDIKLLPEGKGFLLVEFAGDSKEDADAQARRCMDELKRHGNAPSMKLFDNKEDEHRLWKVREGGLGATAWVPGRPDTWPGWEDSAVPPEKVGNYLRDLRKLFSKYGYHPSLYGHLGQGCIHCRVGFDLYTAEGIKNWRAFMNEAADLVVSYGGSLSGEHGDGQARAELLPKMFGETLVQAFREFKSIWDPHWKMNPGKVVDPYGITENLRVGPDYNPPQPKTHFQFPEDQGTFARAALRCVGIGNCRQHSGQIMCPSYQVTFEEKDCTRGRARLLFEMMNGEVLTEGWKSEAVKDSLDLCLACKGCKGDCPVNVDMATYKAEFLSHYYEGRLRPRHAYSMGLIGVWAELASYMPGLANFFSQTPGLSSVVKFLGGISQHRRMPPFAHQSFKEWFRQRGPRNDGKPPVILWPDTFNNYFHPEVAKATVEVLEAAGFQVLVPKASLCCGRPLFDFGMLDMAERWLRQIMDALRPEIEAGVPLVGMEPSCLAVFRDELHGLFPHNEDANRLRQQAFTLSEFLNKKAQDFHLPQIRRKALVHGHCHHKSVMGTHDETQILNKLGLDVHVADEGCCGMAGSFGFEAEHYEVSQKIGERILLPAVRKAEQETLIIADGFSCMEQIEQGSQRRALHLAQVIQMALRDGAPGPAGGGYPEEHYPYDGQHPGSRLFTPALVGGALALGGGFFLWKLSQRRSIHEGEIASGTRRQDVRAHLRYRR